MAVTGATLPFAACLHTFRMITGRPAALAACLAARAFLWEVEIGQVETAQADPAIVAASARCLGEGSWSGRTANSQKEKIKIIEQ